MLVKTQNILDRVKELATAVCLAPGRQRQEWAG